jgi:DNA-binding NarL/FixJ family response regulator
VLAAQFVGMTPKLAQSTLFTPYDDARSRLTVVRGDGRVGGTVRVTIAHAERLVRVCLGALLEREAGIDVIGEAADGDEAIAVAQRLKPDVCVIGESLPGLESVLAMRRVVAASDAAVIVLTAAPRHGRVFDALRAGAAGLLLLEDGEPAELVRAVRLLARGADLPARKSLHPEHHQEDGMRTAKVIEMRRGSAHGTSVSPTRPVPADDRDLRLGELATRPSRRSQGGRRWSFAT